MDQELVCPCCSGKPYRDCCSLYHQGKEPETAQALMRSRYSAYALNNVDYIIRTTYPTGYRNIDAWKEEILNFSFNTDFEKLEIIDAKEQSDRATVVFIAHLKQKGEDITFTERSFFAKVKGCWLYVNGDLFQGENRDLKA